MQAYQRSDQKWNRLRIFCVNKTVTTSSSLRAIFLFYFNEDQVRTLLRRCWSCLITQNIYIHISNDNSEMKCKQKTMRSTRIISCESYYRSCCTVEHCVRVSNVDCCACVSRSGRTQCGDDKENSSGTSSMCSAIDILASACAYPRERELLARRWRDWLSASGTGSVCACVSTAQCTLCDARTESTNWVN